MLQRALPNVFLIAKPLQHGPFSDIYVLLWRTLPPHDSPRSHFFVPRIAYLRRQTFSDLTFPFFVENLSKNTVLNQKSDCMKNRRSNKFAKTFCFCRRKCFAFCQVICSPPFLHTPTSHKKVQKVNFLMPNTHFRAPFKYYVDYPTSALLYWLFAHIITHQPKFSSFFVRVWRGRRAI